MAIQKIVNHPLTRRMNFGSPWTLAQSAFIPVIVCDFPAR
jgi:hypothetical protein